MGGKLAEVMDALSRYKISCKTRRREREGAPISRRGQGSTEKTFRGSLRLLLNIPQTLGTSTRASTYLYNGCRGVQETQHIHLIELSVCIVLHFAWPLSICLFTLQTRLDSTSVESARFIFIGQVAGSNTDKSDQFRLEKTTLLIYNLGSNL